MSEFRTIAGYNRQEHRALTHTMEDYLEMICRYSEKNGFVRIQQLADLLHVKPSSVSKMAKQLLLQGYIDYEKYGFIRPTQKGREEGEYLLHRHKVLHEFLCMINGTQDELEQVEQMEHYFNRQTVENIERVMEEYRSHMK